MMSRLSLLALAALALSACSPSETAAPAASAPASAPAATVPASAPQASAPADGASAPAAANCEVVVESNDQMKFNTDHIAISRQCAEFTVVLKHVGSMPKAAMGHNLVISKTADLPGVVADGIQAGADADFVKAGDERIVAHTKLIGGGEETRVSFAPSKLAGSDEYSFFCSFPGHESLMKGKVTLTD